MKTFTARKLWGWFIFTIGLLWLVGGIAGWIQRKPGGFLLSFLGLILVRMGYNIAAASKTN